MSTVELETGREEAERLVRAALNRTDGVRGYTVDGDTFTVQFAGFGSTFGQRMGVTFHEDAPDRTMLKVTARRTSPVAFTANPWKHKAAFLNHLRTVRDDPDSLTRTPTAATTERGRPADQLDNVNSVTDAQGTHEYDGDAVDGVAASGGDTGAVDSMELETLRAVRLLLVALVVLIGLVLLGAWLVGL